VGTTDPEKGIYSRRGEGAQKRNTGLFFRAMERREEIILIQGHS
jgi:hypothetical protein